MGVLSAFVPGVSSCRQEGVSEVLEFKLQTVVSWNVGAENPESSGRIASLDHWAISPGPNLTPKLKKKSLRPCTIINYVVDSF